MYRADEFLEARINTREYVKNFEIKQTYFYVKRNNKHNKGSWPWVLRLNINY